MFAFGGSSSLLAGRHDSTQERAPPELPTPVKFPNFQPPAHKPVAWAKDGDPPALLQHFARIKKPSDITVDQFLGLNISLEPETSIEDLLAILPGVTSYAVPQDWTELPPDGAPVQAPVQQAEGPKRLLSNGRPYPGREDFAIRLRELLLDNHDAFSALTRTPQNKEKKPPRLAHYRKFWEGLDNMAYYWDTSLDEYIPPKHAEEPSQTEAADATETSGDKTSDAVESKEAARLEATHIDESVARKKAKTAPSASSGTEPSSNTTTAASDQSQPINLAQRPATTPAKLEATRPAPSAPNNGGGSSNRPAGTYKGLRIGTGSGMPDGYRVDTVRSFVEPVAWCFGMNIAPHRRPPALQIRNLRVPVRVSAAVWRSSTDRMKARQGFVHGPAAGMRVADYVDFGGNGKVPGSSGDSQHEALLDIMREIGSLLYIAQERTREGRTEQKPGEGKWWTTVPRWGGGKGGEVGEARGEDSGESAPKSDKEERPSRSGRRPTKKKTAAEIWAEIKPGIGYWDPKVEYEAIGKDRSSEWDDVFSVSSVNTHMALLHLRVHPAYVSWIETGELPSPLPADEDWCRPVLRRSRWYDFFNTEDRIEATKGLWMLFGWMARPQEVLAENGVKKGEDVVMKDA
ncbi:hypothetical protein DBV05_g9260 [Lasiodiplodia theobromae]|uniref:Uncharacterized protein n=1 Tax=Lasiodiplodia theobromae TaxID=45133 RepID=A0A5N5D447_9PEZI|nr:hypothetical protein DBV05_g9260 [Lasiodiplodia theobromae]